MKQVQALALGAFVVLFGAAPAFAISESSVTSATGAASVATVSVNAASGASLVGLISGDGPSTASSQTTSVSGCGLSWVLVKRANTRPGVADVWKTATSASLSACTVTGRLVSGSFFVRLTVVVIDGSSGLGSSSSASGKNGAAKAMLTSLQAGSLVYGVGSDWSVVQARTLLSGQRSLGESIPAGLGTFWSQALNGITSTGSLTLGTSAPNSTNWNFSAVELLSSLAPPPPPPCTFTVSPTTLTAPAGGTSSSVTVTASASTCAWTATSNAWLSVAPTGGTGSGSVLVTSAANSGAARSASVTVAGTSVTVTQDAAASGPPTLVATCPGAQSATSPDGNPVAVSYPTATTTGGVAPVTVQGSPASGSLFPVGTTMVTQTATSAEGQSDACTHGVTVTYTPNNGAFAITSVGTFTHGSPVTIGGAQFGTKATAAPIKFDAFEGGTVGANVGNGWLLDANSGAGYYPTYNSTVVRPGSTRSVRANFVGSSSSNIYLDNLGTNTIYMDFWFRFQHNGTAYPGNYKNFRLYNGSRSSYWGFLGTADDSIFQTDMGGVSEPPYWSQWVAPSLMEMETWRHVQVYGKMSAVAGQAGTLRAVLDGVTILNSTNWNWWQPGDPSLWSELYFGNYGYGTSGGYYAYFDDIYVDRTQARVEIGNASTYAASTHREIQPATAWADGAITVTANRGSFVSGQTVYAYVVTAAGAVSPGFPVTLP